MKSFLPLCLFTFLLLCSSCGDFWEVETNEALKAGSMTIGQRVVTMPVGEVYKVPVKFTPDDLPTTPVMWLSMDDKIAAVRNDSVVAVAEGITRLIAFSTLDNLRDTCYAYILPSLEMVTGRYPYDMVVFGDVSVHGTKLTSENEKDFKVVAFVGNEVRGVGQMRQQSGKEYLELRVWGPTSKSSEKVELRCYISKQARMEIFPVDLTFDGGRHGTPKKPLQLVLGDGAKEFVPVIDDEDDNPIINDDETIKIEGDDNDFPDDDDDED